MNEVEMTVQRFREQARQGGEDFLALRDDGSLFLCAIPPQSPHCRGYAPVDSEGAVGLVRRAVQDFGRHYLSRGELAGPQAELEEVLAELRGCSSAPDGALRRTAGRVLRWKHALLHCTLPAPAGGLFEAWQNPDGTWETDHTGIASETLSRAVRELLVVLDWES
jgi:hypothetical protein